MLLACFMAPKLPCYIGQSRIGNIETVWGFVLKFGILVLEGPYQHQASDSAYNFTKAVLDKGHEIVGVFFYNDGVQNASSFGEPPQDDRNVQKMWSDLAAEKGLDVIVCIAAAKRRGIIDENLISGMRISGLGQLTDIAIKADRLITFGD